MKQNHTRLFIIIILITTLILYITSILSISIYNNTLHNSGNWINRKAQVSRSVPASASYMNTMPALFKFKLNLSQWLGYHKLIFTKEVRPKEISFQYRIDPGQYFTFIFNADSIAYRSYGIRISNNQLYPSTFLDIENDLFLEKKPLDPGFQSDTKPHRFSIQIKDDSFTVMVDNQIIFTQKEKISESMFIGFKAGLTDLRSDIDDLVILQKDGSVIEESFFYWNKIPKYSLYFFLFIILYFILFWILQNFYKVNPDDRLKILAYINFILVLFSIFIYYAMYTRISRIYFTWSKVYEGFPVMPATDTTIRKFVDQYSVEKKGRRIWFVGSSQTWGAGVYNDPDTFISILERDLQKVEKGIECINGGVSGLSSEKLLTLYKEYLDKLKPDITIINLSHNDAYFQVPVDQFIKNLTEFVQINQNKNITTIFSIEPNEIDYAIPNAHREAMEKLAQELNIPYINMHKKMLPHNDDAFLWWDRIHFTSAGNQIFANEMYPFLAEMVLKSRLSK